MKFMYTSNDSYYHTVLLKQGNSGYVINQAYILLDLNKKRNFLWPLKLIKHFMSYHIIATRHYLELKWLLILCVDVFF